MDPQADQLQGGRAHQQEHRQTGKILDALKWSQTTGHQQLSNWGAVDSHMLQCLWSALATSVRVWMEVYVARR